ncbi:MAG TPA: hypothetical protein VFO86_14200 [Terriglobia bacterium]|nr:hypothetical protein [Terriglobia bacterium]
MTLKPTPRVATWFLNRFGSNVEDESVMGDLFEQYQRDRGAFWYWRQVLSIVFGGLLQECRRNKWNFLVSLFHAWCVWGGLQIMAGVLLLVRYVLRHPAELQNGISVYGLPMLALRSKMNSPYNELVEITLLSLLLNTLVLILTGWYCSRSGRIPPRSLLLAFITSYLLVNIETTITILVNNARLPPDALAAFLVRALVALLFAPALLLLGGTRGESLSRREREPRSGG